MQPLIHSGRLKSYTRYDIKYIFGKLNSFYKNLKLTIDHFKENNMHFLDITIDRRDKVIANLCVFKDFITVERKYVSQKINLYLNLIRLNCLCYGTVIHDKLVILILSNLEITIKQEQMQKWWKKLSGFHYLIFGDIGDKMKKIFFKKFRNAKQKRLIYLHVKKEKQCYVLLHQRHYSHTSEMKFHLLLNMSWSWSELHWKKRW